MSLPTFGFSTTADEVATSLKDRITGKNVIITGTSINGLGFETARVLAKYANLVVITGYSPRGALQLSKDEIKTELPSANIRCLTLDLSSMAAIRTAAQEVNDHPEPIHVLLINNAAAAIGPFKLTADKLESQIGVNHVGHFLFTKLIAHKLLATHKDGYTPRVVFLSSGARLRQGVDLAAFEHPTAETYDSGNGYYQSKSANILTAIELSKQSKGAIKATAIYTNITLREESREYMQSMGLVDADGNSTGDESWAVKTIAQGVATTVVAAFDPSLEDKPGSYLADCAEDNGAIAPHTSDPVMAAKLWTVTEKIIGERFTFQ
ncbi:hypothetical protein B0H10DRAFT_2436334 [Mycena sp. CBHHK59/15]|nr:hypothetical protein B0H10DRAFT_2436334 [Mycena sp. CBHHK59/15]